MKVGAVLDSATEDFAQQIANSVESFLLALRAIAEENDVGRAIPLLLLEITQISLAGARLGVQTDFTPRDGVPARRRARGRPRGPAAAAGRACSTRSTPTATSSTPMSPETVESQLSDDITAIASDLENGLRHYRAGDVDEALWWWQFSYVASWGNLAGTALNALLSVVSHNRLDMDFAVDAEDLAVADEMLDEGDSPGA